MQAFSLILMSFLAVLGLFYLAQLVLELLLRKELLQVVTVVRADSGADALYNAVNLLALLPPTSSIVVCDGSYRRAAEGLCATRDRCAAVTRENLATRVEELLFTDEGGGRNG